MVLLSVLSNILASLDPFTRVGVLRFPILGVGDNFSAHWDTRALLCSVSHFFIYHTQVRLTLMARYLQ